MSRRMLIGLLVPLLVCCSLGNGILPLLPLYALQRRRVAGGRRLVHGLLVPLSRRRRPAGRAGRAALLQRRAFLVLLTLSGRAAHRADGPGDRGVAARGAHRARLARRGMPRHRHQHHRLAARGGDRARPGVRSVRRRRSAHRLVIGGLGIGCAGRPVGIPRRCSSSVAPVLPAHSRRAHAPARGRRRADRGLRRAASGSPLARCGSAPRRSCSSSRSSWRSPRTARASSAGRC